MTPDSLSRASLAQRRWRWGFDGAVVLFLLAFGALAYNDMLGAYFRMSLPWSEDQGIYNHLMWNISHRFSWENTIIYRCPSYLANHFSIIYAPISLIHAIIPDPRTLFLITLVIILCGVWFLHRNALTRLGNRPAAFIMIVLLLTHHVMIRNAMVHGFRDVFLALGFLCLALWGYERQKFWPFVAGIVLAAMCKEDMPLLVAGFALPAFVQRRSWRWRLFPLLFGLSYAAVAFLSMPRFGNVWWEQDFAGYRYLGESPGEVLRNAILHPSLWLAQIARPENIHCFRELLRPFGYLAILAPEFLLIPIAHYAQLALNSQSNVTSLDFPYVTPVMPFVFFASVVGLCRLVRLLGYIARRLPWLRFATGKPERLRLSLYALAILLTAVLLVRAQQSVRETFAGFRTCRTWMFFGRPTWEDERMRALVAYVPDNAVVSAQYPYLLPLCMRPYIYCFPHEFDKSEYIVVDLDPELRHYPASDAEYQELLRTLSDSAQFRLVNSTGTMRIYARQPAEAG